jgi:hypothetical protein
MFACETAPLLARRANGENNTHIKQMNITLHTVELDGKQIAFSSETKWEVQVGRNRGSYSTRYSFQGLQGLTQAVLYYRGINIGNGYKKRLYSPDLNKPILARAFSF